MTKTKAPPRLPIARLFPFHDSPAAALHYYIFAVSFLVFAIATGFGKLTMLELVLDTLVAAAAVVLVNYLVWCMHFGRCMAAGFAIVTLIQIAHLVFVVTRMVG